MKFIDTHSHLNFPAYKDDRSEVIGRMFEQEVGAIDVGTNIETSENSVKLAQEEENIWASAGVHPVFASHDPYHDPNESEEPVTLRSVEENMSLLRELLGSAKAVAIGECGLDYFRITSQELIIKKEQKKLFIAQVGLAKEKELPLIIHCRPSPGTQDAYDDLTDILSNTGVRQGVIHFYTGDLDHARKFIELGFHISFSGVITFAKEYEKLVRELPLENVLIETDCPYASPVPYRGKRNEPSYVVEVARKIAEIKSLSLEEVAEQTTKNAVELFDLL